MKNHQNICHYVDRKVSLFLFLCLVSSDPPVLDAWLERFLSFTGKN